MIAGQCSGIGKSTLSAGLLMALRKRGRKPQAFKAGPDFMDPMQHSHLSGRICRNLDSWMFPDAIPELFLRGSRGAGISVMEGLMGFYDGLDGVSEEGSSSHLAKILNCPVLLVVDASGSSRSVGAVVEGFRRYDPDVNIAGVIVNGIGSDRHLRMVKDSIRDVPVVGGVTRRKGVELKSRHLGLMPAGEQSQSDVYDNILAMVEECVDLDMVEEIAAAAPALEMPEESIFGPGGKEARIGVARDEAFSFYYQDNLDLLESHGAELVSFSPLADSLPDVDGLFIGGGFPELHAGRLQENQSLRQEMLEASRDGMPIYSEGGGTLFLSKSLKDLEGESYGMVGVFDAEASMHPRLQALGYVQAEMLRDGPLAKKGDVLRGHEFHHASLAADVSGSVYSMSRGKGIADSRDGLISGNTQGSLLHIHMANDPNMAKRFVASCREYRA